MIKRTYGKRCLPGSPARDSPSAAASSTYEESSLGNTSTTMVDDARKRRRDIIINGVEREGYIIGDGDDDGLLVSAQPPSVSAATLRAAGRARAMLEELSYHLVRKMDTHMRVLAHTLYFIILSTSTPISPL